MTEEVAIQKLVHGGQGMGQLSDGRKVFVWNAYPGEKVLVRLTKKHRDYAEGIAEQILEPSQERVEPVDEAFLSTSPWQTISYKAENMCKQQILTETFVREGVVMPDVTWNAPDQPLKYRNKMEYSFWGDDNGLHLALFHRGSHGKRIVAGSSIAHPEIDETANKICAILGANGVMGSQLKTVVVRANQQGETVAALFVKDKYFPEMKELDGICRGVVVNFSNPKSPASVITKRLYSFGDITLTDPILGKSVSYDVNSFFQVNVPVFEKALTEIIKGLADQKRIVDMYAGVGTIGIPAGAEVLVELDPHNIEMTKQNAKGHKIEVVQASTEKALEYITSEEAVIFDPPRAGLHNKVTERILEARPPKIAYLSCNPATQARDLGRLQEAYKITSLTGYNFFPRTPHIESLAILELR